jgi:hypothetical protein
MRYTPNPPDQRGCFRVASILPALGTWSIKATGSMADSPTSGTYIQMGGLLFKARAASLYEARYRAVVRSSCRCPNLSSSAFRTGLVKLKLCAACRQASTTPSQRAGRDERRAILGQVFLNLELIEKNGGAQGLQIEDIFDAAPACWSARRLATGQGRSLPEVIPFDSTGLPMAIWW